jgi:hypothetical protein
VVWEPARAARERVRAGVRRVIVTRSRAGGGRAGRRRVVVTAPKEVARLARIVDRLPVAVPGPRSCPNERASSPVYRLAFTRARHKSPRLVATQRPCLLIAVTVNGRRQPTLQDSNGRLARAAARAIHRRHPGRRHHRG